MMESLAMGKYGAYVWSSFGLTLIVVATCIVQARHRHRKTLKDITARLRAMEQTQ